MIQTGSYYHIFIKSKLGDSIFKTAHEKHLFMGLYKKFFAEIVETVAFSVLDNHAHWVIYIPETEQFKSTQPHAIIGKQIAHLLRAYSFWRGKRKGQTRLLFEKGYQRKRIPELHLKSAILFVSCNPVRHLNINSYIELEKYPFCSFTEILSKKPRLINLEKLTSIFGCETEFLRKCASYLASKSIQKMKSALEV